MSVFRCNGCDNYIDGDFDGCHEDPTDELELLCDDCLGKYACEYCGETVHPDEAKHGMHLACWKAGRDEYRAECRKDDQATGDA